MTYQRSKLMGLRGTVCRASLISVADFYFIYTQDEPRRDGRHHRTRNRWRNAQARRHRDAFATAVAIALARPLLVLASLTCG
jgi:hypothetical protein